MIMKILKNIVAFLGTAAVLFGCSTPTNITYMQEPGNEAVVQAIQSAPIRLKPMDQISVIVNCREPQIAAMFNLPYITRRLGETQSLTSSSGNVTSSNASQMVSGYVVDSNGDIDFPVLGKIHVLGLTRAEATEHIKSLLIASNQIKDPVVTVEFMNLGFSVLGEVARPGRYRIDRDEFTVLDAISLAGDLSINGERENITVIRDQGKDGERFYKLDITNAAATFSSPASTSEALSAFSSSAFWKSSSLAITVSTYCTSSRITWSAVFPYFHRFLR